MRIFLVDREEAQENAIKSIFGSQIVYCKIHIWRNLVASFTENSEIARLYDRLIHRDISADAYKREVQDIASKSNKHRQQLNNLIIDLPKYAPEVIEKLYLKGKDTTSSSSHGRLSGLSMNCVAMIKCL